MKKNTQKLIKYSSAIGALLAVSGANAAIQPGVIMNGQDGDAILDQSIDDVKIDIDGDTNPDFVIYRYGYSGYSYLSIYNYNGSPSAPPALNAPGFTPTNFVELNSESFSSNFVKKFNGGDAIGPLDNPNSWGMISGFSGPGEPSPALNAPFNNTDNGYIGVSHWNGDAMQYGWIKIDLNNPNEPTVIACALENTPNTPIAAGMGTSVPLLPIASATGLGLIGLMAAMKKRKQKLAK